MKDFKLRNDTLLLFRNDASADLEKLVEGKRVLFVYGGGSVKANGCYADVCEAVHASGGELHELKAASRELVDIERGIGLVRDHAIELVIGAGGAAVMDCAKLVAFGALHESELWEFVKGSKDPYGEAKLPLVLIPTYPSSGSEYGLGAVAADARTGDFGTAYGIPADVALLVPSYSLSLDAEMTAYTGLVTLVQLSASTIGDKNPVSYSIGISVIRNVLQATERLREDPHDLDARGIILYGASISTSSRLGLGKESNYAYDLYELEFIPEMLFGAPYRTSLTTVFPRFLKAMAHYHEDDIKAYLKDAFGFEGGVADSADKLVELFEKQGVSMYFDGKATPESVNDIAIDSVLSPEEIYALIAECCR